MFSLLSDKLQAVFKDLRGHGKISEANVTEAMREVRMALLEADVEFQVAKGFIARVREKALGQDVLKSVSPGQQMVKIFHDELTALLGGDAEGLNLFSTPTRILMVGLHGAGKTTTSGKLAAYLKKEGRRPVLIACDLVRPAAIEQLATLGRQIGVPVFQPEKGETDVLAVARRATDWADAEKANVQIFDTAGRLEIDEPLVQELRRLKEFINPHEVLLVCDAATGQQAVSVARHFHDALGVTGIILTKIDGDARGGAALSMREVTQRPIKFVGVGEKVTQFEPFHPERFAGRILGMGDVVSLVEKAAEAMQNEDAESMARKLQNGNFDLNDFLDHLRMMKKLGPLEGILSMIPGMGQQMKGQDMAKAEGHLKRSEAIVCSMTKLERARPDVLNARRRKRIASGSGTSVTEVNTFLQRFGEMQKMVKGMRDKGFMKKMMSRLGGGGGDMGGMGGSGPGPLPPRGGSPGGKMAKGMMRR